MHLGSPQQTASAAAEDGGGSVGVEGGLDPGLLLSGLGLSAHNDAHRPGGAGDSDSGLALGLNGNSGLAGSDLHCCCSAVKLRTEEVRVPATGAGKQ